MGYVAVALLVVVLVFSLYVIFNHSTMPATVVAAASGALFVDVVGLLVGIWKIVLPKESPKTALSPVTKQSENEN